MAECENCARLQSDAARMREALERLLLAAESVLWHHQVLSRQRPSWLGTCRSLAEPVIEARKILGYKFLGADDNGVAFYEKLAALAEPGQRGRKENKP